MASYLHMYMDMGIFEVGFASKFTAICGKGFIPLSGCFMLLNSTAQQFITYMDRCFCISGRVLPDGNFLLYHGDDTASA